MSLTSTVAPADPVGKAKGPLRLGLTHETLTAYFNLCLPNATAIMGGPYTYKRHNSGWKRDKLPLGWAPDGNGSVWGWPPLTELTVYRHLLGKLTVAVPWPEVVDCFEFDFDRKRYGTRSWKSVERRILKVCRALGLRWCDGILWRSSGGKHGGVRWRVFLDQPVNAAELRAAIVAKLEAAGVRLEDGEIELWPSGDKTLRLPLGSGSCLLDNDGEPISLRWERGRWVRDLDLAIRTWEEHAQAYRVSAAGLMSSANTCSVVNQGTALQPPLPVAPKAKGKRTSPGPCTDRGQRNVRFGQLLCSFYTGQGLDKDQVYAAAEAWLRRTDHVGSLAVNAPGREQLVKAMLKGVPADLARQDRKRAQGQLKQGCRSPRARQAKPYTCPGLTKHQVIALLIGLVGRDHWRDAARDCLTGDDWTRIGAVRDPWLQPRLEVLVGLVRYVEFRHGPTARLAIDRRALETIAGGRALKVPGTTKKLVPYRLLLEGAQAAGFIGALVTTGRAGATASIYELPCAHPVRAPSSQEPS